MSSESRASIGKQMLEQKYKSITELLGYFQKRKIYKIMKGFFYLVDE